MLSTRALRALRPWHKRLAPSLVQARNLNIHEYQGKELLREYNINTQKGGAAKSADEAHALAEKLGIDNIIIKAQIHAGGRGKGTYEDGFKGGVHFASTPAEVRDLSGKMMGKKLVTHQTGPAGAFVNTLAVLEAPEIKSEKYLALLMDRTHHGPVLVASAKGGVDIEEVAATEPEAIITQPIDIVEGLARADAVHVAQQLGFEGTAVDEAADQMERLYQLFLDSDATQIEINPFGETDKGEVYCFDAKFNFDDNASFRQERIFQYRDETQEDAREVAASKYNLNYIGLDGNIGCMVNGAGLAMGTMDIIKLYGGDPANFLDVGGSASEEQVTEAFKILQGDAHVKAILVNIFGGIMRCDTIASGIVSAARQVGLTIPLVVRLEGTNVEEGRKILQESGIKIVTASDLDDAAKQAVASISAN